MLTLDRYVLRCFLSSLLICAASLTILYVIIDLIENLDDLLDAEGPFLVTVASYYGAQLPLVLQRFGSFITLAGAMFAVARLQASNELLAIRAGGVSVLRGLAPILVGALVVGALEATVTETVIPRMADQVRAAGGLQQERTTRPGYLSDDRGSTLFAGGFDRATDTLRWVSFRERDADGRLLRVYYADEAVWTPMLPEGGYWRAQGGWRRDVVAPTSTVDGEDTPRMPQAPIDPAGEVLRTTLLPIDIESLTAGVSLLRFNELRSQSYERQPDLPALRVQLHQRLSGPLAHVILCLLGIPFVLWGTGRKSMLLGALALMVICSLYFLATFFLYELGARGSVPPFWAAWLPTALFGVAAVALWETVET